MDILKKESDCEIEVVIPAKKKKMKQAQLPFQMLNSSKTTSSKSNEINKKKRKVISPLVGSKSPKVVKLATKENSEVRSINEKEEDEDKIKINTSNSSIEEITPDDKKKDLEQIDQKKIEKGDTLKRSSLGKNKKMDKLQQKPGTLTKFLKKSDNEMENIDISHENNLSELKDEKNCKSTTLHKKKIEVCLNETSDVSLTQSELQNTSQLNETYDDVINAEPSFKTSDCDIDILSSDDEAVSELNKSLINRKNETTDKSATPVTPKSNKDTKNKVKKLTPKQIEKKQEIAKRKEEKLKLRMEKEKKREEEKANKRKEKEEKQREKEEKEKIEKEQKKKEKELKDLKKQMELEQKQKEKEAKEEEKRKKEEERQEAERKIQKAASNFASFFVPKKQGIKSTEEEKENVIEVKNFMPFEVKADMKIAPIFRRKLNKHDKLLLDNKLNMDLDKTELYLENIKRGEIVPRTSSKTWPFETKDEDIILLDEDNDGSCNIITNTPNLEQLRPKLLQFKENRRPPYWGTWRKRSSILNARRPFTKDEKWFDYEIDSDDEWEEEEPGESLKGSDDEKDEENPEENEYDVDNEFMVPHGYLSDEEALADEEEVEDMTPQTQKMKLKILGEQFEAERNTKTYKLKPKIIGCIWQGSDNSFPAFISPKVKEFLSARQAWVNNIPIIFPSSTSPEEDISTSGECKTPTHQQSMRRPKTKFPDEALPDLIRLVHGNRHGRHVLMREFMTFWGKKGGSYLSKVSILSKINEIADRIACPEEGPMHLKSCWYVPKNIREQYLPDVELSIPNNWEYILIISKKKDNQNVTDKVEKEEKDKEKEKKHVPLITQFTKKITQEEMKKQLVKSDQEEMKKQLTARTDQEEAKKSSAMKSNQEEIKKQSTSKPNQIIVPPKLPLVQRPPKRATLISVGRGEQFSEKSRQNMLAKFVNLNEKQEKLLSSKKMENNDTNKTT
ncbi:hypothetical protein PUN28_004899 [Cardiocondyla obscurior]